MRLMLAAAFAVLAVPAFAQPVTVSDVIDKAVTGYIQPGFQRLADETATLRTSLDALCATPSEETLGGAREQFKAAVVAFSQIEFVRFGPLSHDNRFDRLLFWPDRKGIALKQVQQILSQQDATAAETTSLRGKSVAVQGFTALEYALFGSGAEELATADGAFRCSYGAAIAGAIATVASDLSADWADPAGIAGRLENPQASYADFRTDTEVLEALTGAIAHGVEAIRDTRLLPFLGKDDSAPKPKSALFWRSGMTIPAIRANFEGLQAFFETSQIGLATDTENLWVDNGARFEFGNALRGADAVTAPIEEALADDKQLRALNYIRLTTQSLQTLLGENLAAALGLSVGFSSLDGD